MPQIMILKKKSRAFLGFGGNLGQPLKTFRRAREQLSMPPDVGVVASSPLYRTPPVGGPPGQADYLNAVVEIETGLTPENLLELCRRLENEAGRTRELRWGPRTLDLDLLLFDGLITDAPGLTLPHPRLHQRHFVLLPLCNLDAGIIHPVLKLSMTELLRRLPAAEGISLIRDRW